MVRVPSRQVPMMQEEVSKSIFCSNLSIFMFASFESATSTAIHGHSMPRCQQRWFSQASRLVDPLTKHKPSNAAVGSNTAAAAVNHTHMLYSK